MANISKIKLPNGNEYYIKDSTALPIRQSGSAYNPNADGYVGGSGTNKYARIKLPENVYNVWQMLYIEVSIRGYYGAGMGGKVLINGYHNATSPYEWQQFSAVTVGKLPTDLGVFGSDGKYIYVNLSSSLTTGLQYQTVSVDKILVGDNLRNYDISDISIDFVAELPASYQTASVYRTFNQYNRPVLSTDVTGTLPVANGGTGKTTANDASNYFLANSGASSSATSDVTDDMRIITSDSTGNENTWYKRTGIKFWNYIKDKISSVLGLTATSYGGSSAKVNNHTVDKDVPSNAVFTDTTYESKAAASGGTAVSLVTTGEKYTWNNKSTVPTNHASTATTYGAGSSSNYGHVKLSSSTSSTSAESGGIAATPSAVKTAYDLANTANTKANTVESGLNGTLIYDHTYSISNGVATFTPHVYLKGTEVTTNYAASCFKWYYRTIDGAQVQITTASDRTCTVTISQRGYGGHVIGTFTPA